MSKAVVNKWIAVFMGCCFSINSWSQEKGLTTSITYTKNDFFHHVNYNYRQTNFLHEGGIGIGVIRTYFQGRIYPSIQLASAYDLLQSEKCLLGPQLEYQWSALRLIPKGRLYHWHEPRIGYRFQLGSTWKVGQSSTVGLLWQNHYSTLEKKRINSFTFGYAIKLSLQYEI